MVALPLKSDFVMGLLFNGSKVISSLVLLAFFKLSTVRLYCFNIYSLNLPNILLVFNIHDDSYLVLWVSINNLIFEIT